MCPPDYYGIEYEINPWMDRRRQSDHKQAVEQWQALHRLLLDAGVRISCRTPVAGLPDLVFTANAAMIYRDMAILSRFRHPERQGEEPHHEAWFAEHGFRVVRLKSQGAFEGAGDALFCGETLLAGYRVRSNITTHQEIGSLVGCRVIPLELVDARFYHLDTCFCPLAPGVAIYYPPAFDAYGQKALRAEIADLIPVNESEAVRFACNAVVLGKRVITNSGCPELRQQLEARGFTLHETPLDEFVKAGGAAKCLILRLDGEEAAGWRIRQAAAASVE
jgi:N-dimethylarginine dimethylaminohydrolase